MPITIDYTPVGALGQLAVQAGQNQAAQQSLMNALRLREMTNAERAQRAQESAHLLQYVLQQKSMTEQARQFDLSRKDQQAQFIATSGARSAAIRASREQADQAFSLRQAMLDRQERDKLVELMKYRTPEDLAQLDVEKFAAKKEIEAQYKTPPVTAQEKLTEAALKEDVLQKIRQQYATPKAQPEPKPTPVPRTAVTMQLETRSKRAWEEYDRAQQKVTRLSEKFAGYEPKPEDAKMIADAEARADTLYKRYTETDAALSAERQKLQTNLEAERSAWRQQAYAPTSPGGRPAPVGPVGEQNAPSGLVDQIKTDFAQKDMGVPATPTLIAEIYKRYETVGKPRPTKEELREILRAGGIEIK